MASAVKHVVLVTTWFYPTNRVASYRMNAIAKYLDPKKYRLSVVSITGDDELPYRSEHFGAEVYRVSGNKWLKKRRQTTSDSRLLHKLKSLNNILVSRFSRADYPGWAEAAAAELQKLHTTDKIDIVISSYAPADAHVAAYEFVRKNKDLKWVADMRDEMSLNPFITAKEKSALYAIEKQIAPLVQAVCSVSKPILEGFRSIMGDEGIRYLEVRNGYDHDKEPYGNFNDVFTLLYAGTFYGKRKPDTFFEALLELQKEGKLPDDWKFQLLGTHVNFHVPSELRSHLEFLPTMGNEDAVDMMFKADCNVLIHPPMGVKGVYTGKLFEYISAEKPVLALVDMEDVAAELIQDQKAGFCADFYSIQSIKEAFLNAYALWKEKDTLPFNRQKVQTLHRRHQVKLLEGLLDELIAD